ncbi:homocysteine S-methyltransferase family protein [bacterium]|nr:homocysteine S-methyltransferase family protein [bacterium]
MSRGKIVDVVKSGRILVSDGAWGTFLHQKGLQAAECPEMWSVTNSKAVLEIASSYIDAGADMVQSNSFGGSLFKLGQYGFGDRVAEVNEAAARISRQAAGEERWVIASIGPTGKMLIMKETTEEALYQAFQEQAMALEKGGADAICIETMFDLGEATQAIRAARENTGCEIISTFTFELTKKGEYRTMMGVSPTQFAQAVIAAGADIIGTNCGNGMKRMVDIVRELRAAAPDTPILVHANAGLPVLVDGKEVYPESPEEMAGYIPALVEAGVNIVGGCCGTTPDHIRALKKAIADLG